MSEIKHTLFRVVLGLAVLAVAVYIVWPQTNKHVLWQQLSPGFIHKRFVIDATTWIIKPGSALQQRLWLAEGGVSELDIAVDCPGGDDRALKLTIYADRDGHIGDVLGTSPGHFQPWGEICEMTFATPFVSTLAGRWIWAEFSSTGTDPVVVFREQSVDKYPGGKLLLVPPGKEITSVLAVRMWQDQHLWKLSGGKILALLLVFLLFSWSMMNTRRI